MRQGTEPKPTGRVLTSWICNCTGNIGRCHARWVTGMVIGFHHGPAFCSSLSPAPDSRFAHGRTFSSVYCVERLGMDRSLNNAAVCTPDSLHLQDIVAAVNLQHDCERGKCKSDGKEVIREEREATTRTRQVVMHTDDTNYLVNINSLHNYKTIAAALPANLRKSSFRIEDTPALHASASAQVREKKRQQTEEKKQLLMAKASNRLKPQPATEMDFLPMLTDDGDLLDVLEAVLVEPAIDPELNEVGLEETIGTQSTANGKGRMNPESLKSSSGGPSVPALEAPGNQLQRTSQTNGGSLYVSFIILWQISRSRLWLHKLTGRKLQRTS